MANLPLEKQLVALVFLGNIAFYLSPPGKSQLEPQHFMNKSADDTGQEGMSSKLESPSAGQWGYNCRFEESNKGSESVCGSSPVPYWAWVGSRNSGAFLIL